MLKRSNKKTLSLFVVIAVLTPFGSVKPMMTKILACLCITRSAETDPCQPQTGTTILDLPYDCLQYGIFQFLNRKQILEYSCVCKDLRNTIEKKLLSSFQNVGIYFFVKHYLSCVYRNDDKNEKIVIEFTGTSVAKNEFKKFTISIMNPTEGSLAMFLSSGFKKLISRLGDIPFKLGIELSKRSNIYLSRAESKGRLYFKEEINSIKHRPLETMLKKLNENLQELVVNGLNEFTGEGVKKLSHLKKLSVYDCPNFNVKLGMNSLRKLVVSFCPKFTGLGVENLINLHTLRVRNCPKFDVLLVKLSLKELLVEGCDKLFIDARLRRILEDEGCSVQLC